MRGICLSKENALFFGIALRHMNSVYNKPAQEVAPTGPPGKVPGLPRLRTSVSPGTLRGAAGRSGRSDCLCRLVVRAVHMSQPKKQKIKRFLLEGICAAYGFESKWVTHLVYVQICGSPVRRAFKVLLSFLKQV